MAFNNNIRMNKRYCLFSIFFLLTVPVFLFSQTADGIEFYLDIKAVNYKQAAWLVLEAANVSGDYYRFNPEEAFRFAEERQWLPRKADPMQEIKLRQVALLIMQAFDLKGGLMYSVFKNPHYAYREMVYQEIIQGRADPGMAVSGESLLFMISQVLSHIDEVPWVLPEEEQQTVPVFLLSETADGLEFYFNIKAVNCEQAAWLVLEAANVSGGYNRLKPDEAFRFAEEKRWLPRNADPGKKIKLRQAAYLIMRAFDIKGGLMYTIFKTSHYAYREMVYQDLIQGRADPGMAVSGESMLFLVSQVLSRMDEVPGVPPEEEWDLVKELNTQLEANGLTDISVEFTNDGIIINIFNNQFLENSPRIAGKEKQVVQEIGRILKTIIEQELLDTDHAAAAGTRESRLRTLEHAQAIVDYLLEPAILEGQ
jgi:hypothetical protein